MPGSTGPTREQYGTSRAPVVPGFPRLASRAYTADATHGATCAGGWHKGNYDEFTLV